jgi:hypothetical protein
MIQNGERKYRVKGINCVSLKKLVKLCRTVNNEMYGKVKIGKYLSSEYKVNRGLRQGDALTPLLLNVVLEIAIVNNSKSQGNIFDRCFQMMV